MVDACIRQVKRGKAAGHDQLTVEHLMYAHPILLTHLSLLFNILKLHGYTRFLQRYHYSFD